jgi:uncharacterized protein (TIGR03437 family)
MRLLALLIPALLTGSLTAQTFPGFSPLVDLIKPTSSLLTSSMVFKTVDAAGDVYLAAGIGSDVPGAAKVGTTFGTGDVLVVKMDARMEQVRFMTVIGSAAGAALMRVDPAGNMYLAGTAVLETFPFTNHLASAPQKAFVLKLSSTGDRLVYAAELGNVRVSSLDVDATGAAYIGAYSYASSQPQVMKISATGDAFLLQKTVGSLYESIAITAMQDGRLAYSTGSVVGILNSAGTSDFSIAMQSADIGIDASGVLGTDAAGNLYVSGSFGLDGDVVAKFTPSGTLLNTRRLPGPRHSLLGPRMAVSPDGAVYLIGDTSGANFPTHNALERCRPNVLPPYGTLGLAPNPPAIDKALVVYSPDGTLQYSSVFSGDATTIALSNDAKYLYVWGRQRRFGDYSYPPLENWNGIQRLDLSRIPASNQLSASCLAHGATYVSKAISPGEIMTIYGSSLGPQTGALFTLANSVVPPELAGTTVTVDGLPAPILYAQDAQVNFIAPWGIKTKGTAQVCIARGGEQSCLDAQALPLSPGAFLYQNTAIVAHQDGTLNSQTNPVKRGQYITLYLTGTGALSGSLKDGGVWGSSLQYLTATTTAVVFGNAPPCFMGSCAFSPPPLPEYSVDVVYAGSAPFLVQGANQINIRIPNSVSIPTGKRGIQIRFDGPGGVSDFAGATVWIAP